MLEEGYKEQLDRVKRWLDRIKQPSTVASADLRDYLYAFFQSCWALKDWIRDDTSVPKTTRDAVVGSAHSSPTLVICADLANATKHLVLKPNHKRPGAEIASQSVTARLPSIAFNLKTGEVHPGGPATSEHTFEVRSASGSYEGEALQIARDAVAEWEKLLKQHGML